VTRCARAAAWLLTAALRVGMGVTVAAAGAGALGACRHGRTEAVADDVPAVVVKADSEGLLLTWIDDKGDFHVEMKVSDVPMMGRDAVRVVDPNREEGTHADRVVVADLRAPRDDGTFPVRFMTRADFEAIAVARREKTGPTLASAEPPSPSSSAAAAEAPAASDAPSKPAVLAAVIVYGAEWCGACHDAMKYLKRKGIPYVEKDVEKDPAAAREMQEKLARNGLRSGSIPVIDVRGKVMVGFNATEIENALGASL
jgi:glutaredoxin